MRVYFETKKAEVKTLLEVVPAKLCAAVFFSVTN